MHCDNCNSERPSDAAFCPTCGASTVATVGAATSLVPVVMVAIVAIALVLGGVAFLTTQKSPTDADPDPTVIPSTTATSVTTAPAPTTTQPPTTSTTISTSTSATTTTTTTTTLPPDPQVVAQSQLLTLIDTDRARLESLVENWLPQVSAKRQGEVWPGPYLGIEEAFPYQLSDIVAEHRVLDERFGVLMANGSEFNFRVGGRESAGMMDGWYISLVDMPFATSDGVLDWCRQNRIDRDNCAAKFITNDQNTGVTLVLQ